MSSKTFALLLLQIFVFTTSSVVDAQQEYLKKASMSEFSSPGVGGPSQQEDSVYENPGYNVSPFSKFLVVVGALLFFFCGAYKIVRSSIHETIMEAEKVKAEMARLKLETTIDMDVSWKSEGSWTEDRDGSWKHFAVRSSPLDTAASQFGM